MNQLKKFYTEAENNQEMKDELIAANEKAGEMKPAEVRKELIRIGKKFGYEITEDDFKELMAERKEGEVQEDDLAGVAGGVNAGCFMTNAGCTIFGEIDDNDNSIFVGNKIPRRR